MGASGITAVPQGKGRGRTVSLRTPLERLVAVVVLLALVPVGVWWGERIVDTPRNGFFEGATTFQVGVDFTVLYAAGGLVVDGQGADIYDPVRLQDAVAERTGTTVGGNAVFANPPLLAAALAGLTRLKIRGAGADPPRVATARSVP